MTSLPKGQTAVLVWSDDDEVKAVVNDDGEIPVNVENMPTTMQSRSYGWDGNAWRKLAMVWGYNDRYFEEIIETTATVDDQLSSSAVPAGEVWVLEMVTVFNNTSDFDKLEIIVRTSSTSGPHLLYETTLTTGKPYPWTGKMTLKESDYIRAYLFGNTAGDDLYMKLWGYKMKVAE